VVFRRQQDVSIKLIAGDAIASPAGILFKRQNAATHISILGKHMKTLLTIKDLTKRFPGVLAVDRVSFSLNKGEILALIGENGAGKSTLTNMLSGVHKPDLGQIKLDGEPLKFSSSHDAIKHGISMVFQELSLVGTLSVSENIFANRQPVGKLNNVHWQQLYQGTRDLLERFGLKINPNQLIKHLSMGQQQILEILKAISTNPKVLILDEPTSSLTEAETDYLFKNIRKLRDEGMSFIYITHKLSEVFEIADRVVVMRDGCYVASSPVSEVNENDLVAMMVGREIEDQYGQTTARFDGDEYFRVERFSHKNKFRNVSFSLKKGEILGFAGLIGAGRTELAQSIFGILPKDSGTLYLDGNEIILTKPKHAIKHRIAYLTEDRKDLGLFLSMPIKDNIVAASLKAVTSKIGLVKQNLVEHTALQKVNEFSIATPTINKKIFNLSGGNQQKCLVAMWMSIAPKVIIFDEPTRGVDVGARAEIYHKLQEFASNGTGIVMISSDMSELIGMCDRILVMHQGVLQGEVLRKDFSEELILSYAAGINAA
jgi:ABC-type sugar transport system ATPase subunit